MRDDLSIYGFRPNMYLRGRHPELVSMFSVAVVTTLKCGDVLDMLNLRVPLKAPYDNPEGIGRRLSMIAEPSDIRRGLDPFDKDIIRSSHIYYLGEDKKDPAFKDKSELSEWIDEVLYREQEPEDDTRMTNLIGECYVQD